MCLGLAWNCLSSSVQTREKAVDCLRNTPVCVLIHVSKGISRCVIRTDTDCLSSVPTREKSVGCLRNTILYK